VVKDKDKKMVKIPRMSEARKAVFDLFDAGAETRERLHREVETDYERLLRVCEPSREVCRLLGKPYVPFTGTREENGNRMLREFFEKQLVKGRRDSVLRNRVAAMTYASQFFKTFHVPLHKYWPDNFVGFDVTRFDEEVVKSDAHAGKTTHDVVLEKWGTDVACMIKALVNPPVVSE
jgi:hypothetical protein